VAKKKSESAAKVQAPSEPVYTVMAFITFVALAIGCTLLYLDYDEYGKTSGPTEKVPTLTKLGDAASVGSGAPTPPAPSDPMAPAPMPMPMPGM
jgi:hypothetical protein